MSEFTVPDSISFSDLEKIAEEAPKEEEQKLEGPYAGLTQEALVDLVSDKLQEISDICESPMAHKAAVGLIIDNMIEWHTRVSTHLIEEGNTKQAIGWARDAGKFQAVMNILGSISVCDQDFMED